MLADGTVIGNRDARERVKRRIGQLAVGWGRAVRHAAASALPTMTELPSQ
jgi:hypothetical protein